MFDRFCLKIKEKLFNFSKLKQFKYLNWFLSLLKIEFFGKENKIFKKGDIIKLNFGYNIGSEINKERFAVVISPNFLNKNYNTLIVLPIKSFKDKFYKNIELKIFKKDYNFLKNDSLIVINQIKTISKKRIIKKYGKLDNEDYNLIIKKINKIFKEKNNL